MTEERARVLQMAKALETQGQTDQAVSAYLRIGAFDEAASALFATQRFADAGHLLLNALAVGVHLFGGLDPDKKKLARKAAACFAKSGDSKLAAEIYVALKEPLRAAEVLQHAGDAAGAARFRAAQAGLTSPSKGATHAAAEQLERSGRVEEALQAYLKLRMLPDAARCAYNLGRFVDAATIFENAGMPYESAVCFLKGDASSRALDALSRIPPEHPKYRGAADQAIRIADKLRVLDFRLDQFLTRFIADGPQNEAEAESFYVLARLYRAHEFHENAREVYQKILGKRGPYRDVAELLAALDARARGSNMALEAIVREETAFRNATTGRSGATAAIVAPVAAARPAEPAPTSPVDANGDLMPMAVIGGRYRVERVIGHGGMATVYKVYDSELDEMVAMKVFTNRNDAALVSRFKQEVSLSRKLAHPNVVRLYDIGEHAGYKFLTMELLDGQTLSELIEGCPMGVKRGVRYLVQACRGLAVAHEAGIIHRDIKPENFFVTSADVLKVMDFGIAKGQGEGQKLTVAGFLAGTPAYMSPEQIQNFGAVDHRTDLYALGIVAYEVFTGRVPFEAPDTMPLLMKHVTEAPTPPSRIVPAIPPKLDAIILKLLEKDREKRVQSCRDLETLLASLGG